MKGGICKWKTTRQHGVQNVTNPGNELVSVCSIVARATYGLLGRVKRSAKRKEVQTVIDITGVDLVVFAKKVYDLSSPQGMGVLHYTPDPLTDDEAKQLVAENSDRPLSMDYVKGCTCKMVVWRNADRLGIRDTWYDHTDRVFKQLLESFGIKPPSEVEHGIACGCMDCQSKSVIEE